MLITILLNPLIVPVFPALAGGFSGTEKKKRQKYNRAWLGQKLSLGLGQKANTCKKKKKIALEGSGNVKHGTTLLQI